MLLRRKHNNLFLPPDYLPKKKLLEKISCSIKGKIIKSYHTPSGCLVSIILHEEKIVYCIEEPEINAEEINEIQTVIAKENMVSSVERESKNHVYYINKILTGMGPLYPLLTDDNIEEIALNNPMSNIVIIHREVPHGWIETNIYLNDEITHIIAKNLAKKAGKPLSPAYPFAEGVLPEGHRIAVTLGKEVSRKGTGFVIRLSRKNPFSLPELVSQKTLSPLMAAYLWLLAEKQGFIMFIGGMATGKTTLLQSILNMLPDNHRVVTIEDTPELQLVLKNWDPLVTRPVYYRGAEAKEIGLYELSKFALRRRAEHLVIGETRGEEARILAQASATGHGSMSTFHADTVRSALFRLMSEPISLKPGFAGLIWAFVQLRVVNQNKRRVVKIIETVPRGPNRFSLTRIFKWDGENDAFLPENIDDVIKKSYRLRELGEMYGMNMNELSEELAERTELISSLARKKVNSIELREFLKEFYKLKQGI